MQISDKNVMIDLETLGTDEDCAFISLGAIEFDPHTGKMGREFYERVSWQSNFNHKRTCTEDTLKWWIGQSVEARMEIMKPGHDIEGTLDRFMEWYPRGYEAWGNSARFDLGILAHAFRTVLHKEAPWMWWAEKDVKTLRDIAPYDHAELNFEGTPHHALHDAIYQSSYVSIMIQKLKEAGL